MVRVLCVLGVGVVYILSDSSVFGVGVVYRFRENIVFGVGVAMLGVGVPCVQ